MREEREKNHMGYVIGGVSVLRIVFSTVLPQETPIWIARWMPRNLFRVRSGWGFIINMNLLFHIILQ